MSWASRTLGEISDAVGGIIQTGPFGSQLHESDYAAEGVPVVMPADIVDGKISERRIARVPEGCADRLARHRLFVGDIVYGRRGDIGRQALVRAGNEGWLCGTGCLRVSIGRDVILPEFLHYYLSLPQVIGWIEGQAVGATMPNLNTGILRRVPVRFPERISVQEKIVAILSAYDDLIDNNRRRIALLEKIAEELYREWFVRFRFPGHERVKVVKGVPEGWELVKVNDAFKFLGGGTPSKEVRSYWEDGTVNWFTPSDITAARGLFLTESSDRCSEDGLKNSSAKMFPAYSVMMTSRATIGAIGINTTPACTNQGFITCIPNDRYPLTFLYHWLKLSKPHFEMLSGGATFAELTKGTFKRIEVLTPPAEIVRAFDMAAAPMFQMAEKLVAMNRSLSQTRDMLLPRLISGKLSVDNLDIQFPAGMRDAPVPEETADAV